jgi:hypothetical protein
MISWAGFLIEVKKLNAQQLAEFDKFKNPPIAAAAAVAPAAPDFDQQIEYLNKMLNIGDIIARPNNTNFLSMSAKEQFDLLGTKQEFEQLFGGDGDKVKTNLRDSLRDITPGPSYEKLASAELTMQLNTALINSAGNRPIKELADRKSAIDNLVRSETAKKYVFIISDLSPAEDDMQKGILYLNLDASTHELQCSFLNSAGAKETINDPLPGVEFSGTLTEDIVKKHFNDIADIAYSKDAPFLSSAAASESRPSKTQTELLKKMQEEFINWQKAAVPFNKAYYKPGVKNLYNPFHWNGGIAWTKAKVEELKSTYVNSFDTYHKNFDTQRSLLQQHAYREDQNYSKELKGLDERVDRQLDELNKSYNKDPINVDNLLEKKTLLAKMETIVHDADKQRSELTKNIIAARKLSLSAGLATADAAALSTALGTYSNQTSGDDLSAQAQTKASQVYVTLDASYEWHIMDNKTSDQDLSGKKALNEADKIGDMKLGTNQSVSAAVSTGKTVVGILRDKNDEVAKIAMSAYPNGASVKVTHVNSNDTLTAQQAYTAVSMLLERALRTGESPIKITTTEKNKKALYTRALNDLLPVYFPDKDTRPTITGKAYWSAKALSKEDLWEYKKIIGQKREKLLIQKQESSELVKTNSDELLAQQIAKTGLGG